jgi:hypothetical protein
MSVTVFVWIAAGPTTNTKPRLTVPDAPALHNHCDRARGLHAVVATWVACAKGDFQTCNASIFRPRSRSPAHSAWR